MKANGTNLLGGRALRPPRATPQLAVASLERVGVRARSTGTGSVIFATLLLAVVLLPVGCRKQPTAVAWKAGTTVIPGMFGWDVEADSLAHSLDDPTADFWWEHVSPTERYLAPLAGTQAAVVKRTSFEEIGPTFFAHWRMPEQKIDGSDDGPLAPGAVVVFRTRDGTLGKLQVVRYYALHDFSAPAVKELSEEYQQRALQRENVERYHIEVKWQLYRTPPK